MDSIRAILEAMGGYSEAAQRQLEESAGLRGDTKEVRLESSGDADAWDTLSGSMPPDDRELRGLSDDELIAMWKEMWGRLNPREVQSALNYYHKYSESSRLGGKGLTERRRRKAGSRQMVTVQRQTPGERLAGKQAYRANKSKFHSAGYKKHRRILHRINKRKGLESVQGDMTPVLEDLETILRRGDPAVQCFRKTANLAWVMSDKLKKVVEQVGAGEDVRPIVQLAEQMERLARDTEVYPVEKRQDADSRGVMREALKQIGEAMRIAEMFDEPDDDEIAEFLASWEVDPEEVLGQAFIAEIDGQEFDSSFMGADAQLDLEDMLDDWYGDEEYEGGDFEMQAPENERFVRAYEMESRQSKDSSLREGQIMFNIGNSEFGDIEDVDFMANLVARSWLRMQRGREDEVTLSLRRIYATMVRHGRSAWGRAIASTPAGRAGGYPQVLADFIAKAEELGLPWKRIEIATKFAMGDYENN